MTSRIDAHRSNVLMVSPWGRTALLSGTLLSLALVACGLFGGPPDTPANQRYGYEGSAVVLSWEESGGADSYTIYHTRGFWGSQCLSSSGELEFGCDELVSGIQLPTYTHFNPPNDDNYYWIVACDESGCSEIDNSNPAQPPPPSPINVRAIQERVSIRVIWDPVPGATHYRIYTGIGCDRHEGCVDESMVGTSYTHTPSPQPPRPPSGIKVVDRTDDSLTVEWGIRDGSYYDFIDYWVTACNRAGCSKKEQTEDSVSYEYRIQVDYYQVNRITQESGHTLVDSGAFHPPYIDKGLQPSTIYYYTVQACNDNGCSDESDESGGLTESIGPVDVPYTPRIRGEKFDVSAGGDDAGVSWNSVNKATYYEVYQDSYFDEEISAPQSEYRDFSPNRGF